LKLTHNKHYNYKRPLLSTRKPLWWRSCFR